MGITYVFTLFYTLGIYFFSLATANVIVFSVHDVLVGLDTFGHVTISRTNITDWTYQASKENSEVFVNFKEARLLDRNGLLVKSFMLSSSELRHFELTDFQTNQYTGVSANGKSMRVRSLGDAENALELRFYIFTESGTIHPDVAPQKVNLGDVRIDVILSDLTEICKDCSDIKALDLILEVSGKEEEEVKTKLESNNVDVITISRGAKFVIPDQLSLDETWDTMPEGFPQLEAMDKSVEVTLRFPAFRDQAVFGFTVKPMKLGETGNEANKVMASVDKDKRNSENGSAAEMRNCAPKLLLLLILSVLYCI